MTHKLYCGCNELYCTAILTLEMGGSTETCWVPIHLLCRNPVEEDPPYRTWRPGTLACQCPIEVIERGLERAWGGHACFDPETSGHLPACAVMTVHRINEVRRKLDASRGFRFGPGTLVTGQGQLWASLQLPAAGRPLTIEHESPTTQFLGWTTKGIKFEADREA